MMKLKETDQELVLSFKYRASVHKCARHEIAGLPYKKVRFLHPITCPCIRSVLYGVKCSTICIALLSVTARYIVPCYTGIRM